MDGLLASRRQNLVMNASLRIAKIFGIPVRIHWTFALLLLWIFYSGFAQGLKPLQTAYLAGFTLLLFVCVILHEFGHALTARRFGVGTRDITISPIGGIARLDAMPEKPYQEFLVAIAGPLVNVAIALVLSGYYTIVNGMEGGNLLRALYGFFARDTDFLPEDGTLLDYFLFGMIALNGILAVFNMMPAFPMDGGRVLRALLSIRMGRPAATRIAARIGQVVAVGLAAYGIWQGNWITVFIGVFVFMAAAHENQYVRLEAFLSDYRAADVVRTVFTRLQANAPVYTAVHAMQHGLERYFLVFDENYALVGAVSEGRIVQAARQSQLHQPLADIMDTRLLHLHPDTMLRDVWRLFQSRQTAPILPVVDAGTVIGVIDYAMMEQFLGTQQKIKYF